MSEEPAKNEKNDKSLFGLVNAAQAMIDSLTAPAPEPKKIEAPATTAKPAPRNSVMRQMESEKRFLDRQQILEDATLKLLVDLKSKDLLNFGEKISIKLETDINHQYVTLKAEIEKSLQK